MREQHRSVGVGDCHRLKKGWIIVESEKGRQMEKMKKGTKSEKKKEKRVSKNE